MQNRDGYRPIANPGDPPPSPPQGGSVMLPPPVVDPAPPLVPLPPKGGNVSVGNDGSTVLLVFDPPTPKLRLDAKGARRLAELIRQESYKLVK